MQRKTNGYCPDQNPIALFVDLDNFDLRGKGQEISLLLGALNPWGKVVIRRVYGRSIEARRYLYGQLLRHGFLVEECKPAGKKNGADIRIAVEVMDTLHTRPDIRIFALASGDSDFTAVVDRLHRHRCLVIGTGSEKCSAPELVRRCDRFLFYESIAAGVNRAGHTAIAADSSPLCVGAEAMRTLLRRRHLYPPEPQARARILEVLGKIPVAPGTRFGELQERLVAGCETCGISKHSVRNCIRALTRAGLIAPQVDLPLCERPVSGVPEKQIMEQALFRLMADALLAEENLVADPVAMAEAIWGDTARAGEMESLVRQAAAMASKKSSPPCRSEGTEGRTHPMTSA